MSILRELQQIDTDFANGSGVDSLLNAVRTHSEDMFDREDADMM